MSPHVPLWLFLLFLLSGGEFWHAPSFQITGQSDRETSSLFANSAVHTMLMSIWPGGELGQYWAVCSNGLSPTWLLRLPSLSVPY